MDRSHEPRAPYEETTTSCRLSDQMLKPRAWHMPVPLRVKHTQFNCLRVIAPVIRKRETKVFTLSARTQPHVLIYPGPACWLVLDVQLPWIEETPTDLLANETPLHRVDGVPAVSVLTTSSHGMLYMSCTNLSRAALSTMATRVLELEPTSRILVRLLPRYARGAVRYFKDQGVLQFWTPL